MHEYPVTCNILNIALSAAEKAGAKKITEIRLVIGDLSSIIGDSVEFYFDMASKGTAAEGARLLFKRIRAQIKCRKCGHISDMEKACFSCPCCGGACTLTDKGYEFYIEGIYVK